jgi:hypothetical protein
MIITNVEVSFFIFVQILGQLLINLIDAEILPKCGDRYTVISDIDYFQKWVGAFCFDRDLAFLLHEVLFRTGVCA